MNINPKNKTKQMKRHNTTNKSPVIRVHGMDGKTLQRKRTDNGDSREYK
jgi:hypothetical protein